MKHNEIYEEVYYHHINSFTLRSMRASVCMSVCVCVCVSDARNIIKYVRLINSASINIYVIFTSGRMEL